MRPVTHLARLSFAAFAAMFAFGAWAEPQPAEAEPGVHAAGAVPAFASEQAAVSDAAEPTSVEAAESATEAAAAGEPVDADFSMAGQMEVLEPYKLVRSLQFVQDSVVHGDHSAMEMQRFLIGVIDSRLRQAKQEVFDDPRNVDAALIYAMSGGNPATLDILAIRDKFGNFDNEVTTVLRSYLNGRAATTTTSLAEVVEIYRDTEIGPYITLVAANVTASRNDVAALELFDWARLTAPGTLLEEAALRRSLFIAAHKEMVDEALHYARLYARRFINSPYAGQYADLLVDLVVHHYAKVGEQGLGEILSFMDRPRKREVYLRIARKAVIRGLRDLAMFASDKAETLLTASDKTPQVMTELYSGMAKITTDDVNGALTSLDGLSERRLSQRDRALREAARVIANEVVRKPVLDSLTQALPAILEQPESGKAIVGGEKQADPIFKSPTSRGEVNEVAEDDAFKGYVSDRKQTLERIDKLLEGIEEDTAS
ncbi:chemotaxis protein [Hoeflea sp. YIM 152468]|uniref:chemotaxis protein n=1 Tax=Hoeflea sp. YIM 152468 TaxID=3031759 RepID=UPI0023DB5FE9|nr:chemotaxis protein [Hoeflea sp. YIM 152468]MDF1610107.1 chemotaxis protein [Hoeflea sp. YIM 152468]